jgi:hypothetical protein
MPMKKIELFLIHHTQSVLGVYHFETNALILKKGTVLNKLPTKSFRKHPFFKKYEQLLIEGLLDGDNKLKHDYEFSSPSLAASLIKGNSTNGLDYWKVDVNRSLKDYLERDLTLEPVKVQLEYIHDFLKDIDILEKLKNDDPFNIFSTLKIVNNEIRHSNVIAWLLDPFESHGLNDFFTKNFVREIYLENSIFLESLDIKTIFLWDFDKVDIYREKDSIDILLVDHTHSFILVLENKVHSKEHNNQLYRYKDYILKRFPSNKYKHFFVFLNALEEEASDDTWMSVSYDLVLRVLYKTLPLLKDKIKMFVEDYINIIRRNIMEDEKLAKLCREIYSKHRDALDLIYQYKPDHVLELTEHVKDKLSENNNIKLNQSRKGLVRFSSDILYNFNYKFRQFGHSWVKDNSIILYEVKIQSKKIIIVLVVGPTIDGTRGRLIDQFERLTNKTIIKTNKWTTIDKLDLISFENMDDLEIIKSDLDKKIANKVQEFIQKNDNLIIKLNLEE